MKSLVLNKSTLGVNITEKSPEAKSGNYLNLFTESEDFRGKAMCTYGKICDEKKISLLISTVTQNPSIQDENPV